MTPLRVTLALMLVMVAVLLAAGCARYMTLDDTLNTISLTPLTLSQSNETDSAKYWIKINPVSDKRVGESFVIRGVTNIPHDEEISVNVYRSMTSYPNRDCSTQSCVTGNAEVFFDKSGYNLTFFIVNSSTFTPDEYIVLEKAVQKNSSAAILINLNP